MVKSDCSNYLNNQQNHFQPNKRMSHYQQFMKITHLLFVCYGVCPFHVKIWTYFLLESKRVLSKKLLKQQKIKT